MINIKKKYIAFILKWKIYIISLIVIVTIIFSIMSHHDKENPIDELNHADKKQQIVSKSSKQYKSSENESLNHDKQNEKSDGKVFIDIKGAVKNPNVYQMSTNDRVIDAINKARPLKDADLNQVNLSERLVDQKLIYVPKLGESAYNNLMSNNQTNINNVTKNKQINLNSASETDLKNVPGIGPNKAKEIINYREQNGGFNKIEDLKKIKGFGEKTFEKLKEYFNI